MCQAQTMHAMAQLDLLTSALSGVEAALSAGAEGNGFSNRQCDHLAILMGLLMQQLNDAEASLRQNLTA